MFKKSSSKVIGLIMIYTLVFFVFALLKHFSYSQNSNDVAVFDQSAWNFIHGKNLYNSIEEMNHLGVHNSPVLYLIAPIYALFPSPVTLIFLQCLATGLGIGLVYLIAKKVIHEKAGLMFALLFSLYHPLHGVTWDILNELAYVIAPLLLMFYAYLLDRPALLWLGAGLALLCKEEIGFVVGFFGAFLVVRGILQKSKSWQTHGILLALIGLGWSFFSLEVVIPYFRNGPYQYFSSENRYAEFGNSITGILLGMLTNPIHVIRTVFTFPKPFYCLELLAPLAFFSLKSPAALWVALPILGANLLSNASMMSMVGARYPAAILPFVFVSAIYGVKKTLSLAADSNQSLTKIFKIQLVFTLLCTLLFSSTPLRIPFKIPRLTSHTAQVARLIRRIPAGSTVSTQANFTAHIPHGCFVSSFYRKGAEYVLLDLAFSQWYQDSQMTPMEIQKKEYQLLVSKNGLLLFKKKQNQREQLSQARIKQPPI